MSTVASSASQSTQPTSWGQSAGLSGLAFGCHSGWRMVQRKSPGRIWSSTLTRGQASAPLRLRPAAMQRA